MERIIKCVLMFVIVSVVFFFMYVFREFDMMDHNDISERISYFTTSSRVENGKLYYRLYDNYEQKVLPKKYDNLELDSYYLNGLINLEYIRFCRDDKQGYLDLETGDEILCVSCLDVLGNPVASHIPVVVVSEMHSHDIVVYNLKNQDTMFVLDKKSYDCTNIESYGEYFIYENIFECYGVLDVYQDTIIPFKYDFIEIISDEGSCEEYISFLAYNFDETIDVYDEFGDLVIDSCDLVTVWSPRGDWLCSKNGIRYNYNIFEGDLSKYDDMEEECVDGDMQ